MIVVVDGPIAKKYTSYVTLTPPPRRKIQDMILPAILDGFIMVLMRRIEEEEEVFSGCITSRREVIVMVVVAA